MFERIDIDSLELNPFSTIGTDDFLVTAGDGESWNTMTAGWGFFGVMWSKPSFAIVVRDSRHTYGFLERSAGFTASFFPPEYRKALQFCGAHSGRDTDKAAATGLTPIVVEGPEGLDLVTFEQANMVFCCSKASRTVLDPSQFIDAGIEKHYPKKDYHTLYIGYIDQVLVREE
ncbi:MAG: flavin reductase [Sphaerochaetaceae bacterium]|jgi:flavin reductase (DIM6/NTAB) family NADH-FMN oxidoreductase RutF|nr:flavin reductase [Sphaerochaetaceae bacterium]MDD3942029.1 flavin reductase [Sphaerochaetaceae bacterium]MDX9939106.1 flavin reductase [Sphaerochaetaceae bacterium]